MWHCPLRGTVTILTARRGPLTAPPPLRTWYLTRRGATWTSGALLPEHVLLHHAQSPRFAISSLWTASTENFAGQCLGDRVAGGQDRPCHTDSKTGHICSQVLINDIAAGASSDFPSSTSDWDTVLPTTRSDVLNWHPNRVLFAVIQLLCSRIAVQQKVRRSGKQRNPLHML